MIYQSAKPPPPPPQGATCWICLDDGPSESEGDPLLRNCSCRGPSAGFAHISCIAEYARRVSKEAFEKSHGNGDDDAALRPWTTCPNCEQEYVGNVALAMAEKFVESNKHLPDFSYLRYRALSQLGAARLYYGDVNGAASLFEPLLDALKSTDTMSGMFSEREGLQIRAQQAEICMLLVPIYREKAETSAPSQKMLYYKEAKECAERAYAIAVELYGPENPQTLLAEQTLVFIKEAGAEANGKQPVREDTGAALRNRRKIHEAYKENYGKESETALIAGLGLSFALGEDGRLSEAEALLEESLETSRRVLGRIHPNTKLTENQLKDVRESKRRVMKLGIETSSTASVAATIVGHPSKPELNGRQVQVLKRTKDGDKFLVILHGGAQPAKFKAMAKNLVFAGGTRVAVRDLRSAGHLNGKSGLIQSYDEAKGRYAVAVDESDGFCGLMKPNNVEVLLP